MKQEMSAYMTALWKAIKRYGWFPLLVFMAHEIGSHVFHVYGLWPPTDIFMHFFGGCAIAYFSAGALIVLEKEALIRRPEWILCLALVFGAVCAAVVFWEFAEWLSDRYLGTSAQLSLDDTIFDMFLGVCGGISVQCGLRPR